ncbi:hypothetical protein AB0D08_30495 [Kitasatospora sp. NPDC048540]|uniref:hypothetical protein n=1 Tax=unclassified Kitasatospora TaxID=2633591 RepID=UPI00053A3F16|nr:hypothetical protein [Kitasatospora sp. MBT63]
MTRQRTSGPQDPEDFYADHEEYNRRVLGEADFPVYGVERGVNETVPAREAGGTPPRAAGEPAGGASGTLLPAVEAARTLPGADRDALAEYEVCDGRVGWIEVRSGDWSSADGPYVTVRTYRPGAERERSLPELEDVVEDERDRVYEQLDIDEGDGPGRVRAMREWITVEGEPRAVQIHEDRRPDSEARPVWAGRLRVDGITVTVTGRGVPPGGIELRRIEDFDRYVLGRTALLRRLAVRQRVEDVPLEERVLAPVSGLEAHRAVVEHGVSEVVAMEAQIRSRRAPRLPRRLRGEAGTLRWEAAVRQQMRLASESRDEATEAVSAMVNQLTRLAQNTDWLVGTAEGQAAVEEVIRYTVFASEVPSLPAQRAWDRLWSGGGAPEQPAGSEEAWLTAWEQWRLGRIQH